MSESVVVAVVKQSAADVDDDICCGCLLLTPYGNQDRFRSSGLPASSTSFLQSPALVEEYEYAACSVKVKRIGSQERRFVSVTVCDPLCHASQFAFLALSRFVAIFR